MSLVEGTVFAEAANESSGCAIGREANKGELFLGMGLDFGALRVLVFLYADSLVQNRFLPTLFHN